MSDRMFHPGRNALGWYFVGDQYAIQFKRYKYEDGTVGMPRDCFLIRRYKSTNKTNQWKIEREFLFHRYPRAIQFLQELFQKTPGFNPQLQLNPQHGISLEGLYYDPHKPT